MAPIMTIFGPNRSRRPKLKFEKKIRTVVAVVVGVVVVDRGRRRHRGVGGMAEPLNPPHCWQCPGVLDQCAFKLLALNTCINIL